MLRNTQPQQLDAAQSLSESDSKSIVLKSPTSALPRQLCWTAHKMVHSETRQRSLAMWPKLPSWQRGKTHWTKKSRKLWPLPWMLKTNTKTTSLLLFSCTQTWWNLCERGGLNRTNKNMENRGGKSAREMGPYLRSKLKSSTKMISWMRLGGVRFRTLQGSREEKDSLCELPK